MDVVEAERSDQLIVFVACMLDSLCISNNYEHITDHEKSFVECAKRHVNNDPKFVKSMEAPALIEAW
jgi:hypothetical protein